MEQMDAMVISGRLLLAAVYRRTGKLALLFLLNIWIPSLFYFVFFSLFTEHA